MGVGKKSTDRSRVYPEGRARRYGGCATVCRARVHRRGLHQRGFLKTEGGGSGGK